MTVSYKLLGVPYTVAQSAVAVPLTGSTSETTLATIIIPGGSMGPNGYVRVKLLLGATGTNSKTFRVKFAGTLVNGFSVTTSLSISSEVVISNRGSVSSQICAAVGLPGFGSSSTANVATAVNTAADVTVLITGQLTSAGESVTLEAYSVDIVYGA